MIPLRDLVKEFSESGHLETQLRLENQLITDLVSNLQSIDPKNHLEFVRVRGQLDAIKMLQLRREEILDEEDS